MTATTQRGAYGGSPAAKQQLLLEARSEWLEHSTDGLNQFSRNEKAQFWALRAGLPPSVVQLALCLCPGDASAADTLGALLLAIPHGSQCDSAASAWWLWLWEQGDGLNLKPLRDHVVSTDNAALAEQVNELHRRVVAGHEVARTDWRRIRAALPAELPGELAVVSAAAWDFRAAPGAVAEVIDAWKQAFVLRRLEDAGLTGPALEAMGEKLHARMNAYIEAALRRPAPADEDESEQAMHWRQAAGELSQRFLDSFDDPLYLRWNTVQSQSEAEFRATTLPGWNALARLLAQT